VRGTTGDEAPANLFSGTELAARESSCPSDRISWAAIFRSFCFEQAQYSSGAVRRPYGDNATIGFAQSLQRNHINTISQGGGLHVTQGIGEWMRALTRSTRIAFFATRVTMC